MSLSTLSVISGRKQDLVRDAVWSAAIDLFERYGFENTTVEEIAAAAGVSRRSFFRYFSSKDDLMAQAIVSYGTYLADAIAACPAAASDLDIVRQTVLAVATAAAAQPRTRAVMQIVSVSPAARQAQLSRRAELEQSVAAAFSERLRKGPNRSLTARLLAGITLSILDVVFHTWFGQPKRDIRVTAEQTFTVLTRVFREHEAS